MGQSQNVRHEVREHSNYEESVKYVRESGHRWTILTPAKAVATRLKKSLGQSEAFNYVAQKIQNPNVQKALTIVISTGTMTFGWWIANPTNPGNTVLVAAIFATAINLAYTVGQKQIENYMKFGGKKLRLYAAKMGIPFHDNANSRQRSIAISRMTAMIPIEFVQTALFQYAVLVGTTATAVLADPTFTRTTVQLIIEAFTTWDVVHRTLVSAFGIGAVNVYLLSQKPHWGEAKFLTLWLARIATFSLLGAFMINGQEWAKLTVTGIGLLAFATMMKPKDLTVLEWLKSGLMRGLNRGEVLLTSPRSYGAYRCLRAG